MRYAIDHWPPTKTDIDDLIESQAPESQVLEYKQNYAIKEQDDFLKEICAFANSIGGDLVMGIREKQARAEEVLPIPVTDTEAETRRILSIIRSNTTPPLTGVKVEFVSWGLNFVPVVRVAKSMNSPHSYSPTGKRFPIRVGAESRPMEYTELRDAFLGQDAQSEKLRAFRDERLTRIVKRDLPFPVSNDRYTFVIHALPQDLRPKTSRHDAATLQGELKHVPILSGMTGSNIGVDLDGAYSAIASRADSDTMAAIMMMRSGACELVDRWNLGESSEISHGHMDSAIATAITRMLQLLSKIGEEPPYVIFLSLLNVGGAWSSETSRYLKENRPKIRSGSVTIHEVIFDRVPSDWKEATLGARSALDALANAFGLPRSPSINVDGTIRQ